jgi:ubiquinone/menaquinone biosynthesis C-methylase UbiE
MRRGLERYAPARGYDVGPLARQKYAQMVVQKAGLFPGDWTLDVETGTGILGVQVARAFTRSKVVATDAERQNLERARENAGVEGCEARIQFVQCLPDALPFKDETFFFTTIGLALGRQEEPLDVLDEIHRATGYTGKVYAPALDLTRAKKKPRGTHPWVFDEETIGAMREMGFGKVQQLKVAILPDGAQLVLLTAKRFDPEEEEGDEEDADDGADDE